MSERGLVGVGTLWLMVAVGTVALAFLSVARWARVQSQNQFDETRIIFLAQTAALIERESNFALAAHDVELSGGRFHTDREVLEPGRSIRLRCRVTAGKSEKEIEIDWQRVGETWRATFWRE